MFLAWTQFHLCETLNQLTLRTLTVNKAYNYLWFTLIDDTALIYSFCRNCEPCGKQISRPIKTDSPVPYSPKEEVLLPCQPDQANLIDRPTVTDLIFRSLSPDFVVVVVVLSCPSSLLAFDITIRNDTVAGACNYRFDQLNLCCGAVTRTSMQCNQ